MKTEDNDMKLVAGSDMNFSDSELGDDQGNNASESSRNDLFILGTGDYSKMGEVIRLWEQSRYIG